MEADECAADTHLCDVARPRRARRRAAVGSIPAFAHCMIDMTTRAGRSLSCRYCDDLGRACARHHAHAAARHLPDAPRAPVPAPQRPCAVTPLTPHELNRLARAVAPLADLDEAGGLRALSSEPQVGGGSHGASPDTRALDRACDTGALRLARGAWQRFVQLAEADRDTVAWLATHGAADPERAEAGFIAERAPRVWREGEERARVARQLAESTLGTLQRAARAGMTREAAEKIDAARVWRETATAAHVASVGLLAAWAAARFRSAFDAWFGAASTSA